MSLAVSSIGKTPPRVIISKPSTQLVCSKLQDNGERSSQITKSTTLFPMRFCDKPGTMQYGDEKVSNNFQTLYPKKDNLSNTLSDEKELYINGSKTNAQKYNGNEPKNNANILNQPQGQNSLDIGGKVNTSNKTEKNKNITANLNQIPSYVKCFTCNKMAKEEDFCQHLLFGHVKCIVCNAVFWDCQSFQETKVGFALGKVLCKHMFYYCKDPVQYLKKNIYRSKTNDDSCNDVRARLMIKIYIDKLKSIEIQHPWTQAITCCREYVDGKESRNIRYYVAHPNLGISSPDYIAHSELGISSQSSYPSEIRKDDYHGIIKRKKCTEVVLSQNYDISLLEKTTEFVKVLETLPESLTSSEKGKNTEKIRQESPERQDLSDEESIEFVPIPSDGFYYVSVKPIEECPNCYEVLCPSRFTVNVENFLMTVVCDGCSLTIYITSAAPELQIITDDTVNHEASPSKKEKEMEYHPKMTKKTQVKGHKQRKINKRSMLLQ